MKNLSPFFSIVMPAYNREKIIHKSLNSVSNQTYKNFELIVVDDGSSDKTSEVVESWHADNKSINLKLIKQKNKGIGGARNTGIKNSSGLFIAFLDSDDWWDFSKLDCVYNVISEQSDIELICHDEYLVTPDQADTPCEYGPFTKYQDLLFKKNCISTSATVVKKKCLDEVNYFSENLQYNGVEDYDLWLRLFKNNIKVHYLHEKLGFYYVAGQGITANIDSQCQHSRNVLNKHFEQWQNKNIYYYLLFRKRYSSTYRAAGRFYMKNNFKKKAFVSLFKAILIAPHEIKNIIFFLFNILPFSV